MVTETIDKYYDTDNSTVIIGGLVAIVVILAVTVTVIVILVFRCCSESRPSAKSGHVNTHTYILHAHMFHTQYLCCYLCREVTDSQTRFLSYSHTHAHMHTHTHSLSLSLSLNKSQPRDPDKLQTTSNEAYNVVRERAGSGRVEEVVYETPQFLPLPTSSQPATAAGDYELI